MSDHQHSRISRYREIGRRHRLPGQVRRAAQYVGTLCLHKLNVESRAGRQRKSVAPDARACNVISGRGDARGAGKGDDQALYVSQVITAAP
jgi:hypothetical protein